MWFMVLLTYCVLCWLVSCLFIRICRSSSLEVAAQVGVSAAYLEWSFVLSAPLTMPFILWIAGTEFVHSIRRRMIRRWAKRTVREQQFLNVNVFKVDAAVRSLWQQHTPALFQLGFELLGDYQMKPEPVLVHDRIFLSDDRQTFADICHLLDFGAVSFLSILSDGTVVETCGCANPHPQWAMTPLDQLSIICLPDASIEELHRHHLLALGERSAAGDASILRFTPQQLRPVFVYDQCIYYRWRYRNGDLPKRPVEPDFSTLDGA